MVLLVADIQKAVEICESERMNEQVKEYLDKYSDEIIEIFMKLRQIIYESVSPEPQEMLWAKIPSYYVGRNFIRLIPFKDHINIEAQAIASYREELNGYKITPKGMLQFFLKQDIPYDILKGIFKETLNLDD